jgi:transposase
MGLVVIGMDPHKRSATVEVMAADEAIVGGGRYATDAAGYRAMLARARQWPERVWAVEGCPGIGRHLASRLLADGEQVIDVPAKLSARMRVFATGQGRKTDATGAHAIALAATRRAGLRPVVSDQQLAVLRILADRRRALGEDHTRMVCQLHQLLLELIPGGAKKDLSAAQAKALLATVRPRDAAGKAWRRVAAELITDLERIYQRKKAASKELNELLSATGSTLTALHGMGPSGAARLLVEAGGIARLPSKVHFASWNGTAPIDASSGDQVRHRLSRAGNRQVNRALHIMAVVQLRNPTQGRAYYDAKSPPGKHRWKQCGLSNGGSPTSSTARWSSTTGQRKRAREDTWGRLLAPARPASTPAPALRRSHLPGPPPTTLRPHSAARSVLQAVPAAPRPLRPAAARTGALPPRRETTPLDTEGSQIRASVGRRVCA